MAQRLCNSPSLPAKIISLALLGFLVLILSGPVLAVLSVILSVVFALVSVGVAILSVLLPFALIGLLVWLPYRAFGQGRRIPWEQIRQAFVDVLRTVVAVPRWLLGHGYATLCRLWQGSTRLGQVGGDGVRGLAQFSGVLFLETVSGALVGGLMGLMSVRYEDTPYTGTAIAVGAITGAYLGALVGFSTAKRTREAMLGQPLEELH